MTQDRKINVYGNANKSILNNGDGNIISQINSDDCENIIKEIKDIFDRLSQNYSRANDNQKITVLEMEFQQKIDVDPTFKQRFISATKSGGLELVKVITDNPFISVPLETVRGWIEA